MKQTGNKTSEPKISVGKKKIPLDVQKRMLAFFMRTSIPRKKAKLDNHPLPENKEGGLL